MAGPESRTHAGDTRCCQGSGPLYSAPSYVDLVVGLETLTARVESLEFSLRVLRQIIDLQEGRCSPPSSS